MRRTGVTLTLALAALLFAGTGNGSELYTWTDDNGELHVATSLADVPEKYHDQVRALEPVDSAPERPAATATTESDGEAPTAGSDGLRRFEVPYENETNARRVIIPVTFNNRIVAPMALDTGSPGMVISVKLAEELGQFSRDRGTLLTEAAGIGGVSIAILTIVDSVAVEGPRDEFVPTTITAGLSDEFDGLIGMDFLANYTLSIDTQRRVVVFQENPPASGARGSHDESWWRGTFEKFRTVRDLWTELARTTNLRPGSKQRDLIEFQAREAERLYQRLDLYASDHAVPRHWR